MKKEFWNKKKVFITGHTGFKGSWLSIYLNYLGAEVTGYSLKPITHPNLFNLAKIKNVIKKSIIGDVRNYKKLFYEVKKSKANIIFHLAAQPLVRMSYINPKDTFDTNFIGTLNIIHIIKKLPNISTGIIITTDKVYEINENRIFKENDKMGGRDPYSASKICAEILCKSYHESFFSSKKKKIIATVRAGNVIGGGDYSLDRIIPDIFRSIKRKKIYLRNPNAVRPWQHVLEPLSGYLLLAQKMHNKNLKNVNQNWNFGPNIKNCKSVKYLTKYLCKFLKIQVKIKRESSFRFNPETDILRLSNKKSKKFLNWRPKWSINKTLDMVLEWNLKILNSDPHKVCLEQIKTYIKD